MTYFYNQHKPFESNMRFNLDENNFCEYKEVNYDVPKESKPTLAELCCGRSDSEIEEIILKEIMDKIGSSRQLL
jgi:hypothetical protein